MKLFILIFFLIPNIVFSYEINDKFEKAFEFELTSDSIKNVHYLANPSYILAYLSVNDFFITNHYEVKLINKSSLRVGFGILNFIKSENNNFFFQISIDGIGKTDVLLKVDSVSNKVSVLIEKAFMHRLPENLIMRVERKLSGIFSPWMQNELNSKLSYDLKKYGTLENALIINNFNNKKMSAGFSFGQTFNRSHKFQLISIFLIIFLLMLFKNRIKRKS
jgi:hypothetical protein